MYSLVLVESAFSAFCGVRPNIYESKDFSRPLRTRAACVWHPVAMIDPINISETKSLNESEKKKANRAKNWALIQNAGMCLTLSLLTLCKLKVFNLLVKLDFQLCRALAEADETSGNIEMTVKTIYEDKCHTMTMQCYLLWMICVFWEEHHRRCNGTALSVRNRLRENLCTMRLEKNKMRPNFWWKI